MNVGWHSWLSFYCWFLNGMWVLHGWFPCLYSQSVQMLRVHPVCRRLSACLLNWRQCETGILYSEPPRSGHLKMREAKQKCQCEKVSLLASSNAALPFAAITWVGKRAFCFSSPVCQTSYALFTPKNCGYLSETKLFVYGDSPWVICHWSSRIFSNFLD